MCWLILSLVILSLGCRVSLYANVLLAVCICVRLPNNTGQQIGFTSRGGKTVLNILRQINLTHFPLHCEIAAERLERIGVLCS